MLGLAYVLPHIRQRFEWGNNESSSDVGEYLLKLLSFWWKHAEAEAVIFVEKFPFLLFDLLMGLNDVVAVAVDGGDDDGIVKSGVMVVGFCGRKSAVNEYVALVPLL